GPLTHEQPDTLVTARKALGTQFLPKGFGHRTSLRPPLLQVGPIRFHRGTMGVVAQIDEVLHAQIFANGMRMQMQLLTYLSLGPALRRESMHLLIHPQL